jgi:hypothetical protein
MSNYTMKMKKQATIAEEMLSRSLEHLSDSIDFIEHVREHAAVNGYSEIEVKRLEKVKQQAIDLYDTICGIALSLS